MAKQRRYFKELRMQQLRAMVEIARGKGFAGAASALKLTTPSVWQQIRSLETYFGVPLVDVNGLQVSLTEQGKQFVELAAPLVQGFDSLGEMFSERADAGPRRLSIAAPNSVLVYELPEPIRRYRELFPEVNLSLIDCGSNPGRKLLEEGEVDLAIVGQLEKAFPPALEANAVTDYPFTLVCPIDHPILKLQRIRAKDIVRYPLVVSNVGTNSRHRVDEVLRKAGVLEKMAIAFTASTKELLIQYVKLGFGIAVVSISSNYGTDPSRPARMTEGLAFRDVSRVFGHEHIVILRRQHRHESAHQLAFRECVLQRAEGTR